MKPSELIQIKDFEPLIWNIISEIHSNGPTNQEILEVLAYLKKYHNAFLSKYEHKLMYLLGLFYKVTEPLDLLSLSYSIYHKSIENDYGSTLTPVQSSIQNQIGQYKYFSFSAPTSTGKSHILRSIILKYSCDIVITLPSRALVSEYLIAVREIVKKHKEILVLEFVDDINRFKTNRRIFIITPERGGDLFRIKERLNVGIFIFDEAQISEEKIRGLTFDAFVRRADRAFPESKKIFVHPFVENPEAQLIKHGFVENSGKYVFKQNAVGKIFVEFNRANNEYYLFSPFLEGGHLKKNKYRMSDDLIKEVLISGGSVLIYVNKQFIYNKEYNNDFLEYIRLCPLISDQGALSIINEIERIIGSAGYHSELVELLRRGIVIHHGSIPLIVRYLIEEFANNHYAKICFATSTLAQGVNVPFDLVLIHNARFYGTDENQSLGLKNLIGRAGRTTVNKNTFNYGYVVISNPKTFVERLKEANKLSEISVLDRDDHEFNEDVYEFISAVKNETINENYSLPVSRVERLASQEARENIEYLLSAIFVNNKLITGDDYQMLNRKKKDLIKRCFAEIFEISLTREIGAGEKSILSTAISILLWKVQGRSFRTLLGLRYNYLTRRSEQNEWSKKYRSKEITFAQKEYEIDQLFVKPSPVAAELPDKGRPFIDRFPGMKVRDFNYDLLVYDTYDYIDKVISFSLSDVYISAFDQYYQSTGDGRAKSFVNFMRYGTDDTVSILLMRYGFSAENIDSILPHVISINEDEIVIDKAALGIKDDYDLYLVNHYI